MKISEKFNTEEEGVPESYGFIIYFYGDSLRTCAVKAVLGLANGYLKKKYWGMSNTA